MTARPWMPFYFGDYLADTGHLSTVEHGAYLLLIAHYWMKGSLPTEDTQLARVSRLSAARWQRVKPAVEAFFSEGWKHKRIEFELTECARISEAGRKGGKASAQSRREAKSLQSQEPQPTTVERPLNDQGNDPPTIGQPLQLQPQQQKKKEKKEPRAKRARSPLPDEWRLSPEDNTHAQSLGFRSEQIEAMGRNFHNNHRAKGSVMADWHAAWRTWCDREIKFNGGVNGKRTGTQGGTQRSGGADFFAGLAEVAADINGHGTVAGNAAAEVPVGRVNIDG